MSSRTFLAGGEKSLSGFKVDSLVRGSCDFKLKPIVIYYFGNLKVLMNYAKSPLPVLYKQNNKAWMTAHVLTTWPVNILSPLLRPTAQKKKKRKKIFFKVLLFIDNVHCFLF